MKKTWLALFLALCMLTTLTAASACCAEPSDMDKTQTMEETCPCMMDGKGVDGCACMKGMCDEKCGCGETCDCAEKKLEMLTAEMNGVFEANMDLWNKFFGMLDKQPDMDMTYADYLTEQLEAAKESFTEDEYKLLQQDIETIRRLDAEMDMLMPEGDMTADSDMMMDSSMVTAEGGMVMGNEGMAMADDNMDKDMMDDNMADKDMMMEDDSAVKFPAFEGKDLDGNPVTSELFKNNAVTVVNFWFSACAPLHRGAGRTERTQRGAQAEGRRGDRHQRGHHRRRREHDHGSQEHSGKEGRQVSEHLLPRGQRGRKADLQYHGVPHDDGGGP